MFLKYIISSYKFTMLIISNRVIRTLTALLITIPLTCIIGMMLAFLESKEFRYKTLILGLLFCTIHGTLLQIIFMVHKNLVVQVMNRVLSAHKDFPNFINKNITQKAENIAEEESTIEILIFILSSSLCVFCPYLYFITRPGIKFDHPDVQICPYFFTMWKNDSVSNFIMWKCLELVLASIGLCTYYSYTIFLTYTMMNLKMHVKEINRQLNGVIDGNIHKHMKFSEFLTKCSQKYDCFILDVDQKKRNEYEKSIDEEFVKIVLYYNFIHDYIAEITKLLHKPMTALFAWYISSTVLFTIAFLMVTEDFIHIMKMLSLVIHSTISLHLFCNVAEIIYDMNENLMDSFYNTSWYCLLPKSRKNLSIILALCQKKYKVKSFGMYIVNLNLFIFAVRMVYSVMNIVLIVQRK